MEKLRQQAGRKQPEGTDLEIRGDNWGEGGEGGGSGQNFSELSGITVVTCMCVFIKHMVHMQSNINSCGLRFEFKRLNSFCFKSIYHE